MIHILNVVVKLPLPAYTCNNLHIHQSMWVLIKHECFIIFQPLGILCHRTQSPGTLQSWTLVWVASPENAKDQSTPSVISRRQCVHLGFRCHAQTRILLAWLALTAGQGRVWGRPQPHPIQEHRPKHLRVQGSCHKTPSHLLAFFPSFDM